MIDLHIHTSCSDGLEDVNTMLAKAQELELELISITDHNHCLAYDLIKPGMFGGLILRGCEMATSFEGNIIEFLGYGVDTRMINSWFHQFYSPENLKRNEEGLFLALIDICRRHHLRLSPNLRMPNIEKGISKKTVYNDLVNYEENRSRLPEGLLDSYRNFFRKGLSNPGSPVFAGEYRFYPAADEIIRLMKDAGGLVFLAHLFEYDVDDSFAFLERLRKEIKLDGIECYHSSFQNSQIDSLMTYAGKNHLFISGGSDYHGKPKASLGFGRGNLNIEKAVVSDWLEERYLL